MNKAFIGGSRSTSRLNVDVQRYLDNITHGGNAVLIGDANGADKAVQAYLHSKRYGQVEVFCTEDICRNNVGNWVTRRISAESHERNAQFYTAKDKAMAQEATSGFMVWDGKSVGTLLNIYRLVSLHKRAVIYIVPLTKFREFNEPHEWNDFIAICDKTVRQKIEQRIKQELPRQRSTVANPVQTVLLL